MSDKHWAVFALRDIQNALDQDRYDVASCHIGDAIAAILARDERVNYLVTRALKVDPHAWLGMSIGNCSLTVIKVFADGSMKVLSFGDVGHIPPNLQTGTWPAEHRDLAVP